MWVKRRILFYSLSIQFLKACSLSQHQVCYVCSITCLHGKCNTKLDGQVVSIPKIKCLAYKAISESLILAFGKAPPPSPTSVLHNIKNWIQFPSLTENIEHKMTENGRSPSHLTNKPQVVHLGSLDCNLT